jgi:pyridoxal/pyridoxine/pyridoxamine kinase
MTNVHDFIDEVMTSELSNKKKKDKLLEYDSIMYCYLGSDSTKTEKERVKKNSRAIYRAIAKFDPVLGKNFLWYID